MPTLSSSLVMRDTEFVNAAGETVQQKMVRLLPKKNKDTGATEMVKQNIGLNMALKERGLWGSDLGRNGRCTKAKGVKGPACSLSDPRCCAAKVQVASVRGPPLLFTNHRTLLHRYCHCSQISRNKHVRWRRRWRSSTKSSGPST